MTSGTPSGPSGRSASSTAGPSSPTTSSGSCAPGRAPTAPRTSSAGRSSWSRTATGSRPCPRPAGTPGTSPAPPPPSRWSRPTRSAPGEPLSVVWDVGGAAAQMMLVAWELGHRQLPGHRLRARPWPASSSATRRDCWCEYILSFGYPADPAKLTAPLPRPAVDDRSTTSSTGALGRALTRGRSARSGGQLVGPSRSGSSRSTSSASSATRAPVGRLAPAPARPRRRTTRSRRRGPRRASARSESSHLCSSTSQYAWTRSRSGPTNEVIRASVGR